MSSTSNPFEYIKPFLRGIKEDGRIYPSGKRIEVVFIIRAVNLLLLRTEGPRDINEATLPESKITVPIIQPQKIAAVTRRRMLQILRLYRDSGADLEQFISNASGYGFTKAEEHQKSRSWNCSIQPPLAEGGIKATDIGMDGYCPACTIFGVALVPSMFKTLTEDMSLGLETRVHFDPAFATVRKIQPETHNKVAEGTAPTTGGSLFDEIHVMPGTVFIGRLVLHDVTEPELKAVLYSLATVEELGGRAGIYGTVRVELLGIRGGKYSVTTALDLADKLAGVEKPSEIVERLKKELKNLGFTEISNNLILSSIDPSKKDDKVMKQLWESSIEYVRQVYDKVKKLTEEAPKESEKGRKKPKGD